jgi:DNA-binding MarR family transcriptional regulator
MRMSELAVACDMSLSGMTRLAAKLESLAFLERVPCESDGPRLQRCSHTGRPARLREAWPTHLLSARRHIFDHLDELDLHKLAQALEAIAASAC